MGKPAQEGLSFVREAIDPEDKCVSQERSSQPFTWTHLRTGLIALILLEFVQIHGRPLVDPIT